MSLLHSLLSESFRLSDHARNIVSMNPHAIKVNAARRRGTHPQNLQIHHRGIHHRHPSFRDQTHHQCRRTLRLRNRRDRHPSFQPRDPNLLLLLNSRC